MAHFVPTFGFGRVPVFGSPTIIQGISWSFRWSRWRWVLVGWFRRLWYTPLMGPIRLEPFLIVGTTLWSLWQQKKHSNANWLFGASKKKTCCLAKLWYFNKLDFPEVAGDFPKPNSYLFGGVWGRVTRCCSLVIPPFPKGGNDWEDQSGVLWRRFLWMFSWCSPSHGVQMWQPLFCCPSQTLLNLKRTTKKHRNRITNLNYLIFIYLNRQSMPPTKKKDPNCSYNHGCFISPHSASLQLGPLPRVPWKNTSFKTSRVQGGPRTHRYKWGEL